MRKNREPRVMYTKWSPVMKMYKMYIPHREVESLGFAENIFEVEEWARKMKFDTVVEIRGQRGR